MANALVIYDGPGPLPKTATFKAPSDSDVIFVLSGTSRTESAACLTEISVVLDGVIIGTASCWANQNNNHMAMRTTFVPFDDLSFGEHTIAISNKANTITDVNDNFQVVLMY
jgi:hypothetical protein